MKFISMVIFGMLSVVIKISFKFVVSSNVVGIIFGSDLVDLK